MVHFLYPERYQKWSPQDEVTDRERIAINNRKRSHRKRWANSDSRETGKKSQWPWAHHAGVLSPALQDGAVTVSTRHLTGRAVALGLMLSSTKQLLF